MNDTTITLNDHEATLFREYLRHADNFELITASGVMDIREGSAEIHFDAQGRIGAIKAHVNVYKKDPMAPIIVINRARP